MSTEHMRELSAARTDLRHWLARGVKGAAVEARIDELIHRHQAAVKDAAAERLDDAQLALARVRQIHQSFPAFNGHTAHYCRDCEHPYPCPTIRAIEGADR